MQYFHWFYLVILVLILLPYIGGPLLILSTFKFRFPTRIVFFDPDTIALPRDVAEFVEPAREKLIALGFRPEAYFCLPDVIANVKSISVLLVNTGTNEGAMVSCIYAETVGISTLIKTKYVEFITRFRDGVCVQTSNSPELGAFRHEPNDHTIQFWDLHDVAELYRRHQRISERLSAAPRKLRIVDEFRNDVEQYLQTAVLQEPLEYQVQVGLFRQVPDGYRPTLKGALVLTWQELWPWKYIRKQARLREARRWLEEIGSV